MRRRMRRPRFLCGQTEATHGDVSGQSPIDCPRRLPTGVPLCFRCMSGACICSRPLGARPHLPRSWLARSEAAQTTAGISAPACASGSPLAAVGTGSACGGPHRHNGVARGRVATRRGGQAARQRSVYVKPATGRSVGGWRGLRCACSSRGAPPPPPPLFPPPLLDWQMLSCDAAAPTHLNTTARDRAYWQPTGEGVSRNEAACRQTQQGQQASRGGHSREGRQR